MSLPHNKPIAKEYHAMIAKIIGVFSEYNIVMIAAILYNDGKFRH